MQRRNVGFGNGAGSKFLLRRRYCGFESVARFLHAGNGVILRLLGRRRIVNLEFAEVERHARGLRRHERAGARRAGFHCHGVLHHEAEVLVRAAEVDYGRHVVCQRYAAREVVNVVGHVGYHVPLRGVGSRRACAEGVVVGTVQRHVVGSVPITAGTHAAAELESYLRHGFVERELEVVPAVALAQDGGCCHGCFPNGMEYRVGVVVDEACVSGAVARAVRIGTYLVGTGYELGVFVSLVARSVCAVKGEAHVLTQQGCGPFGEELVDDFLACGLVQKPHRGTVAQAVKRYYAPAYAHAVFMPFGMVFDVVQDVGYVVLPHYRTVGCYGLVCHVRGRHWHALRHAFHRADVLAGGNVLYGVVAVV